MAITATDMVTAKKTKLSIALTIALASFTIINQTSAGEWSFTPTAGLTGTYSDNVQPTKAEKESSFVSQLTAGLDTTYEAQNAALNLNTTGTYLWYSHDHDLDNDYRTLNAEGRVALWDGGPWFFANASITNEAGNDADNQYADLISAGTVETKNYSVGLSYDVNNRDFIFDASLTADKSEAEDEIGEYEGYNANLSFQNGNAARYLFWSLTGSYQDRENNDLTGRSYRVEAITGLITGYDVNPFLRYSDEDTSGSVGLNTNTGLNSWGAGLRYKPSNRFFLDLSYNFIDDSEASRSDDYVAAAVNWNPSSRTQLNASYDTRFYGDAFGLTFSHRTKRLTNSISYSEDLAAFDRSFFRSVLQGNYWCPVSEDIELADCLLDEGQNIDDYQLVSVFRPELVEANEFALTKSLNWNSSLALARTTYTVALTSSDRESLDTFINDKQQSASFTASRRVSPKTNISFNFAFNVNEFDREDIDNNNQKDYYRQYSIALNRNFARELTGALTLRYIDRDSTSQSLSYEESRVALNLTKEF